MVTMNVTCPINLVIEKVHNPFLYTFKGKKQQNIISSGDKRNSPAEDDFFRKTG